MNEDRELRRLIELANKAPSEYPPMASGFPSKVLQKVWPERFAPESEARCWLSGLRWGTAAAALIMLACILLTVPALRSSHINTEAVFQQQIADLILTQ